MAIQAHNGRHNRILASLSRRDFGILQPLLEPVPLKFRQQLQSANQAVKDVYFLESGLASVVAIGGSGGERRRAEVAIIGREGMTGLPVVHGVERSPYDIVMQFEGTGQRVSADDLRSAIDQSVTLLHCFLRFAHVLAVQSGYAALANAQGNIQEGLARWLLMAHDRIDGDKLMLTQHLLALELGVRRAGVTTALGHFEQRGVIERSRGAITVKDRTALEECANGLYGVPEAEFERLFGGPHPPPTEAR
jgi:CRP-like cAMP-binding protein